MFMAKHDKVKHSWVSYTSPIQVCGVQSWHFIPMLQTFEDLHLLLIPMCIYIIHELLPTKTFVLRDKMLSQSILYVPVNAWPHHSLKVELKRVTLSPLII